MILVVGVATVLPARQSTVLGFIKVEKPEADLSGAYRQLFTHPKIDMIYLFALPIEVLESV